MELNQKPENNNEISGNKSRLLIISGFLGAVFILVIVRLLFVSLISKRVDSPVNLPGTPTLRGIIYDRNMNRLAISVLRYSIAIRPKKIRGDMANFKNDFLIPLSSITGKKPSEILEIIEKHYEASLVYLVRKIQLLPAQMQQLLTMKGVILLKEYDRRYPYENLASHVIGITGREDRGLEGIEYRFDDILKQKQDLLGADIILSIDRDIQQAVEEELKFAVLKENAKSGTVVIMNVENGDILSLANYPDYNIQDYRNLSREEFAARFKNLAVSSSDEIGSSFKAFTISILSELNLIDLNKVYDCRGYYKVEGGETIKDTAVFGKIKFPQVVKVSSNVGMIEAAMTIPKRKYYDFLQMLGFMEKTGIELPYENSKVFRSYDMFRNQSRASVAIGQEIGVTPIQVVTAAAALANGGYLVEPRIVLEIRRDNSVVKKFEKTVKRKIFSEQTNKIVWELLSKVLEKGGTGYHANLTLGGRKLNIVGKTGTAQVFDPRLRRYSEFLRNTSFLGFIKRPRNTYVAFVIVRQPRRDPEHSTGSTIAVPLFHKIMSTILDRYGSRMP